MTESELRDILLSIRNNLKIFIGTDLGKYEITSPTGQKLNEIDAIWVEPPELPANYKVKLNSGIEAIIQREPDPYHENLLGYTVSINNYCITLKQYNLEKSLTPVIERLKSSRYWNFLDQPRLTPYTKTSEGIVRPKATFKITTARLLEF